MGLSWDNWPNLSVTHEVVKTVQEDRAVVIKDESNSKLKELAFVLLLNALKNKVIRVNYVVLADLERTLFRIGNGLRLAE